MMMQEAILGRIWADHHQRIYGDPGPVPDALPGAAKGKAADPLPVAGKAMVLALAVSLASLGLGAAGILIA